MASTITVIDTEGNSRQIEIISGLSLMELLRDEGYDEILAMCGGCCSCATCHVHITADDTIGLPPIEDDEEMLITMADGYDAQRSRLSCQIPLSEQQSGMTVRLVEQD